MLRVDSYEGPRGPATPTPPVTSPRHHSGKRKPLEPPERVCFLRRPPLPFVACRLRPPPPGEASWSGDTFGQGREGAQTIRPPGSEMQRARAGSPAGRRGRVPSPSQAALPRLLTVAWASRCFHSSKPPDGLRSLQPDLTALPGNDTSSAGRPSKGGLGWKRWFHIPRSPGPGSRIPVLPSHGCPAASLAVSLRHGPVRLARPLVLSPAPCTVPPLLPGGRGLNATSSGKPSQTTPSPRGPSHSGYIAPGEGHRWLSQ